ncbi:MAG: site-specific integrase [Candidatus Bathyarchaeota archaeon]|nr:MAG: site-specific integrase [Candidatus Bathyarchaeota archaeon]
MTEINHEYKSSVSEFIGSYDSKNSKTNYKSGLKAFFRYVYGESSSDLSSLDKQAAEYFGEDRTHEHDIEGFLKSLKGQAPKTVRLRLTAVRVFFAENGIEFPKAFWRRVNRRLKGNRALTLDIVPSNQQLKKIFMHLPVQGQALYLMQASSGMRIGEALQLELDDISFTERNHVKIEIRNTKTSEPRHAIASHEAKAAVEEWLKVRGNYLEAAVRKSHFHEKSLDDKKLFPFAKTTAYRMWLSAIDKAELNGRDKMTNWHKMHPHVLRKFFRTRLGAVIAVDVVEALMGHGGYLTEVYRKYSFDQVEEFYTQGEHALLVFTDGEELGKLRNELKESKEQLQGLVNELQIKTLKLERTVEKMTPHWNAWLKWQELEREAGRRLEEEAKARGVSKVEVFNLRLAEMEDAMIIERLAKRWGVEEKQVPALLKGLEDKLRAKRKREREGSKKG